MTSIEIIRNFNYENSHKKQMKIECKYCFKNKIELFLIPY